MMLVTLAEAKRHLRVDFDDEDADITLRVHAASGAVLNYLKHRARAYSPELDSTGEPVYDSSGDPVPELDTAGDPVVAFEVKAAVLLMLGYLYRDRDENVGNAYQMGYLPAPVTALLYALRDPALA